MFIDVESFRTRLDRSSHTPRIRKFGLIVARMLGARHLPHLSKWQSPSEVSASFDALRGGKTQPFSMLLPKDGADIRSVQNLLSHGDVPTAMIYMPAMDRGAPTASGPVAFRLLHLPQSPSRAIRSPHAGTSHAAEARFPGLGHNPHSVTCSVAAPTLRYIAVPTGDFAF